APLSTADIRTMITSIKSQAILQQFRGMPEVDIEALGAILQTVGSLGLLHPEIQEIDLNPIIISGSTPVVVDALIGLQPIRTGAI
ncbi:MAG TPA: acetate--CoA ligase family protein, partial [Candidatus Limnocylindrales bacterium]|nr:acetate--CoA ligase family protein [Candidatus Limnocylindrales bacterium]